jgi:hypothetical protein
VALTSFVVLANCSLLPKKEVVKSALPEGAWWTHGPTAGDAKIVISLQEQRVALFRDDKPVGVSPISSGKEGHSTHPGTYKITEKDPDHRSSWYGAYCDEAGNIVVEDIDVRVDPKPSGTHFVGAEMQFFMRIHGPIGMHRGYLPGYPASHGCIRLPGTMAALFFSATPEGTPVEIQDHASLANLKPAPEVAPINIVENQAKSAPKQESKTSASPKRPEAAKAVTPEKSSSMTWFASLRLSNTEKPVVAKTVRPQQPRLEPASPATPPKPKISRPQPIVTVTPKPPPLTQKLRSKKALKPRPGQTLYWNGN